MLRYIFILLFIFIHVSASSNKTMKIRAKQNNDVISVKAMITHPMYSKEEAKKRAYKANYITNITARVGNEIVYNLATSPYISRNPAIKFKYKDKAKGDTVQLIVSDNNGKTIQENVKIKNSIGKSLLPTESFKQTNDIKSKVWETTSIREAIQELYGSTKTVQGDIELLLPKLNKVEEFQLPFALIWT